MIEEDILPGDSVLPHLLIHGSGGDDTHHVVVPTLTEAMAYAEHLANESGDHTARIFEMREIDISFKTYYQVELASGGSDPNPPDTGVEEAELQPNVVAISA